MGIGRVEQALRDHFSETEDLTKPFIPNLNNDVLAATGELLALSALLGMDHANPITELADSTFSFDPSVGDVGFPEAVDFLKSRIPVGKDEWKELNNKLKFRAFAANRLTELRHVEAVRQKLIAAVEQGQTLRQVLSDEGFKEIVGPNANTRYWEIVYRTNVQTAYNAGRATQIMRTGPGYLEFIGLEDERQTETCKQRSNTILPASDPWWESNWPPLHYNCRSTVRVVPHAEVQRRGLSDRASLEEIEPANEGFGGNPIETGSFYKLSPSMLQTAEEFDLKEDLANLAIQLGLASNPMDTSRLVNTGNWIAPNGGRLLEASKNEILKKADETLSNLKDSFVEVPELGEVWFTAKGNGKLMAFTADPVKAVALGEIVSLLQRMKGKVVGLNHPSGGYVDAFDGRVAVEYGRVTRQYKVTVKRRKDGKWVVYDLQEWKIQKTKKIP